MGSNFTLKVTDWVGFSVTGKVAPDIVNPVPVNAAELMVRGAVPVEVNVTGSVDAVFTVTLPNARLAGLMVNVGTAAFNCRTKLRETPPALPVRVTACAVVTEDTVAVNPALLALAGTITVAGTVTAALLLTNDTLKPPLPAGPALPQRASADPGLTAARRPVHPDRGRRTGRQPLRPGVAAAGRRSLAPLRRGPGPARRG